MRTFLIYKLVFSWYTFERFFNSLSDGKQDLVLENPGGLSSQLPFCPNKHQRSSELRRLGISSHSPILFRCMSFGSHIDPGHFLPPALLPGWWWGGGLCRATIVHTFTVRTELSLSVIPKREEATSEILRVWAAQKYKQVLCFLEIFRNDLSFMFRCFKLMIRSYSVYSDLFSE